MKKLTKLQITIIKIGKTDSENLKYQNPSQKEKDKRQKKGPTKI